MAKLATFPKAWLDALVVDGSMSLSQWITLSHQFDLDGLEFYAGFLDLRDARRWRDYRREVEDQGRCISMLCCSPDFIQRDARRWQEQVDLQKRWVDMTAELGGQYCRVLSGQRQPEVSRSDGMRLASEGIRACLPHAESRGVTLIIENHYKDNYWQYPEFAQHMDVFVELVAAIPAAPWFGVNFDPSNCIICGDDPIALLDAVKHRLATMHASDRYFEGGTQADLARRDLDPVTGYAPYLRHGVIGQGLNDYDRIFSILRSVGFDGWISIEDGTDPTTSVADIHKSIVFLRQKMREHGL
ncbi:MAG: sugar phosphate isomerase/epimerase family protein [Phycisphaeraceae bacterium]